MASLRDEVAELRARVVLLETEMRLLRRGQPRADAGGIEALLGYIHDEFGEKVWTTALVFEIALENPALDGAIVRCFDKEASLVKFSRMLGRHLGNWGSYRLECIQTRSREGARFRVTQFVTSSQRQSASVQRTR